MLSLPPLTRFALPACAALVIATPAAAQIPLAPPTPEVQLDAPLPEPVAPPAAPMTPVPAAPSAPAAAAEGATSQTQPSPAKADHLSEPLEPEPDEEDELDTEGVAPETPARRWYGWQTLTADGISTVLFFSAFSDPKVNEPLAWGALLGYEFAPGIVHFAHRNPGRAFASFGIRLGMPLAGAFVGGALASGCKGYECEASGAGVGVLLGMGGAIAIDAAVLAYETREPRVRSARIVPVASVTAGRAWLGVAGEL